VHAVQPASLGQHVVDDLDRVVRQDADVRAGLFADALEQRAHAGLVHLAAQEVVVRQRTPAMWAVASPMPKPISSTSGRGAAATSGRLRIQRRPAAPVVGQQELGTQVLQTPSPGRWWCGRHDARSCGWSWDA
jgi:hypothetical protein